MSAATDLCEGCLRSLDEIAGWSGMQADERRAVWTRIRERAGALQRRAAMPCGDA
jgi:predicted Fe-S protein YdhL (DUF1289 family)